MNSVTGKCTGNAGFHSVPSRNYFGRSRSFPPLLWTLRINQKDCSKIYRTVVENFSNKRKIFSRVDLWTSLASLSAAKSGSGARRDPDFNTLLAGLGTRLYLQCESKPLPYTNPTRNCGNYDLRCANAALFIYLLKPHFLATLAHSAAELCAALAIAAEVCLAPRF